MPGVRNIGHVFGSFEPIRVPFHHSPDRTANFFFSLAFCLPSWSPSPSPSPSPSMYFYRRSPSFSSRNQNSHGYLSISKHCGMREVVDGLKLVYQGLQDGYTQENRITKLLISHTISKN
ncbi:hypothetical protein AMTRI_Chr03g51750 [Amborella trichopoda]